MWRALQKASKGYDGILLVIVIVLSCIGLAAIYSVDLSRGDTLIYFPRQLTVVAIGLITMLVISRFHVSFYESHAKIIYVIAFVLLVAVLFFGVHVNGATRWFRIFGLSFQPAEFAKIALVIFLAWRIDRQARQFQRWQFVVAMAFLTGLLAGLIMLQPDLGSALILGGVWFGVMLLTGIPKRYTIGLVIIGISIAMLSWFFFLQEYQKSRVLTFLDPGRDPLGSGYHVTQSIIAIGAGGLTGRGLGFGSQSQLHFLPEAQTDFIFSVIGEELGFVGSILVIILYALMMYRLARIAFLARTEFASYLTVGITLIFFLHICVNIGGTLGLLPLTGVTLPLISYGGSSVLANFALIGIAESVYRSHA